MNSVQTLEWMRGLMVFALVLQTLEYVPLRAVVHENGVWRWSLLRRDWHFLPQALRKILDAIMGPRGFDELLGLRLLSALTTLFFPHPAVFLLLFLTTLLISVRWRGVFNGGSDYMTIVVLTGLLAASAFPQHVTWAIGYVAFQLCLSYFVSGVVKLRRSSWRSGVALRGFLLWPVAYEPSTFLKAVTRRPTFCQMLAWGVILFECTFPLAMLNTPMTTVYMTLGVLFHLANVYIFGLNRFLWVWLAAYPALWFKF